MIGRSEKLVLSEPQRSMAIRDILILLTLLLLSCSFFSVNSLPTEAFLPAELVAELMHIR